MKILYEDNHIIAAVKPQNVPSQADSSGDVDFLSQIKNYVRVKYKKPGEAYIGLVHRLDRPTGGVMVFARTSKAAARLSSQMKNGTFEKTYYAIVRGDIPPNGTLVNYLHKNKETNISAVVAEDTLGAKRAELCYRVIGAAAGNQLAEVRLKTGRSHQIRVQMAHIGAPLVGDGKYGGQKNDALCLWSYRVGLMHPTKKESMEFCCNPPDAWPWNELADCAGMCEK